MSRPPRSPFALWAVALLVAAPAWAEDGTRTEANVPATVTLAARDDHADPFGAVTLDAVVTTPSGQSLRVPAFWAGGRTWRFRYASGEVGVHRYRTDARGLADPGLDGVDGRIEVRAYTGENPLFRHGPIRVADDRRHFRHADGTPFFWLGDTWWMGLCHRLQFPAEFTRLADDRVAKGFNVVQIVAGLYPDMPAFDPRGANESGFPWEPDYRSIRPAYFDAADARIAALVDRGITPCVVGMWGYFLKWMGPEKAEAHWRYLIARYGAYPVVWCVAGEANLPWYQAPGFPYDDRDAARGWTPIVRYVRDTDPFRRPATIHPTAINRYTSRHAIDDPAVLDFDLLQTPHGTRDAADVTLKASRESYAARPAMPVVDGEASYEMLNGQITDDWVRAMFWINLASGAAGHTYGANGIWQCNRRGQPHGNSPTGGTYGAIPWDEAMNLPGSAQMGAARRFLEHYPWQSFEPHPEWVRQDAGAGDDATGAAPARAPRWIWHAEGDPSRDAPVAARYFRRAIDVPAGKPVRRARLRVGADDRWNAWVDGRQVGAGNGWAGGGEVDIAPFLAPGRHALAIRAENVAAPVPANPAGLFAVVRIAYADGSAEDIVTDGAWRSAAAEAPGWRDAGFDDAAWPLAADLGAFGMAPWGTPKPRRPFPPLLFGRADGPRIVFSLEPAPVVVSGLEPGRNYAVTRFDPAAGTTRDGGTVRADAAGHATVADPGDGHDWVAAVAPAR